MNLSELAVHDRWCSVAVAAAACASGGLSAGVGLGASIASGVSAGILARKVFREVLTSSTTQAPCGFILLDCIQHTVVVTLHSRHDHPQPRNAPRPAQSWSIQVTIHETSKVTVHHASNAKIKARVSDHDLVRLRRFLGGFSYRL